MQGWFIFTFILWLCTLRSTVAFCLLFFTLMMAFLMLAIAYLARVPISITSEDATGTEPHPQLVMAGGGFGIIAAFTAGTMRWLALPTGATVSLLTYDIFIVHTVADVSAVFFLSPSPTSTGQTRAASGEARSTTAPLVHNRATRNVSPRTRFLLSSRSRNRGLVLLHPGNELIVPSIGWIVIV